MAVLDAPIPRHRASKNAIQNRIFWHHIGIIDRSVRTHLESLETRLSDLSIRQMQATEVVERNLIEREIRAVKTALLHYRTALEIESTLK